MLRALFTRNVASLARAAIKPTARKVTRATTAKPLKAAKPVKAATRTPNLKAVARKFKAVAKKLKKTVRAVVKGKPTAKKSSKEIAKRSPSKKASKTIAKKQAKKKPTSKAVAVAPAKELVAATPAAAAILGEAAAVLDCNIKVNVPSAPAAAPNKPAAEPASSAVEPKEAEVAPSEQAPAKQAHSGDADVVACDIPAAPVEKVNKEYNFDDIVVSDEDIAAVLREISAKHAILGTAPRVQSPFNAAARRSTKKARNAAASSPALAEITDILETPVSVQQPTATAASATAEQNSTIPAAMPETAVAIEPQVSVAGTEIVGSA